MSSDLKKSTKAFSQTVAKFVRSRSFAQIQAGARLGREDLKVEIILAGQTLSPMLRKMVVTRYDSSGLQTRTGTLRDALAQCLITVTETAIRVVMPSGRKYPNAKGNVYAAAGVFRYTDAKPGFFQFNAEDCKKIEAAWTNAINERLARRGVRVA